MRTIYLDTSELIKGLEGLAWPRKNWRKNDTQPVLQLCYHLMSSDAIVYDGKVRHENKKQIEDLLEDIGKALGYDNMEYLSDRLVMTNFSDAKEKDLANRSIVDAMGALESFFLNEEADKLASFSFGSGLTDVNQYIFEPLKKGYKSDSVLDRLWSNDKITGRRFYDSIYNNDVQRHLLAKWIREEDFTPEHLSIMFTLFRIKMSENKTIEQVQSIKNSFCYYGPEFNRAKLQEQVRERVTFLGKHGHVKPQIPSVELVELGMQRVYSIRNKDVMGECPDIEIPTLLNIPLKENNKKAFLGKVLSFKYGGFKAELDEAIDLLDKARSKEEFDDVKQQLQASLSTTFGAGFFLKDAPNIVFFAALQEAVKFFIDTTSVVAGDPAAFSAVSLIRALNASNRRARRAGTKLFKYYHKDILSDSPDHFKTKRDLIFN